MKIESILNQYNKYINLILLKVTFFSHYFYQNPYFFRISIKPDYVWDVFDDVR